MTTSTPWSTIIPGWPTPRSLPDEKRRHLRGIPCPSRGLSHHGLTHIEQVMTDNAFAYRHSAAVRAVVVGLGARQIFISPTARGRTARSKGSTAPCKPNGPTGRSSPATLNAPPRLHPGSSSTTLNADTPHSAASHRSADCHQPNGRVHLVWAANCLRRRQHRRARADRWMGIGSTTYVIARVSPGSRLPSKFGRAWPPLAASRRSDSSAGGQ